MATLEIYWSFRSPYSYLAIDRLADIGRDYEIDVDFRPVRPLAMREPDFFERGRKQFLPYLFKDVLRESQRLGIPFMPPNPDPIDMDLASGTVASAQPIMDRIMGLGIAAAAQARGIEFARCASRSIWGGVADWHETEQLAKTLGAAGFELEALAAWAKDNEETIRKTIIRNEAAQLNHHWGVPLMVLDGEPFFGQDRLESLVWRLDGLGLKRD